MSRNQLPDYPRLGTYTGRGWDKGSKAKNLALMPEGTGFLLFLSQGKASGTHTQMGWMVDNIEAEVAELQRRGVVFEEYDTPGLKTINGVATIGTEKAAWFKDSEGNLLAVSQLL